MNDKTGSGDIKYDEAQNAERTLATWKARAAELKALAVPAGVASFEQISHLTGLQIYQGMLRGEFPQPPICESADFMLVEVALGSVIFQGSPLRRHYNPMGSIHGGWIATLLDSALALSIQTQLPAGKVQTTAELKINYVRPLTDRVPLVRAEGRVIHLGGRMGTSDARLYGPGRQAVRARVDHLLHLRPDRNTAKSHAMRFLHTMLRVGDLQRSIDFYTKVMGMQLLRITRRESEKYDLAFVGYERNPGQAELELTYNYGTDKYDMGSAYGHIALGVPDAYEACARIKAAGGNVIREAGPVKGGDTVIAFVADPDGYKIELIQRADTESWPDA